MNDLLESVRERLAVLFDARDDGRDAVEVDVVRCVLSLCGVLLLYLYLLQLWRSGTTFMQDAGSLVGSHGNPQTSPLFLALHLALLGARSRKE